MRTKPQEKNRPQTHARLLFVVVALLASSLASIAAVASTAGTARACSVAGPYAEAWPSTDLHPGQLIEIAGWGFSDIRLHEPAQPTTQDDPNLAVPPELCDFDMVPMAHLEVYWQGSSDGWLATVSGPDFVVPVTVPADAAPGPAWITVGSVEIAVFVDGAVQPPPPPPCPLAATSDDTAVYGCPEPWPCPLYSADATEPAPAADYAPGFQPPCPEPCVDYAHTIDDGTEYDYRWDCPDPCSQTQVSPGAGDAAQAVWCPPPDPCPVYFDDVDRGVVPEPALLGCPDPCHVDGGDAAAAIWCPPPEPCELVTPGGVAGPWCPEPCPALGGPAGNPGQWCPEPCPLHGAESPALGAPLIGCPPGCELVGGDALVCPDPCVEATHQLDLQCGYPTTATSSPGSPATVEVEAAAVTAVGTPATPTTADSVQTQAAIAAASLMRTIATNVLQAMTGLRLSMFG